MSLRENSEAAFNAALEVDSGTITVGSGPSAPCLVVSFEESGDAGPGRFQADAAADIVALAKDIDLPRAGDPVELEYAGRTHSLSVAADSVQTVGGGASYSFTVGK